MARLLWWCRRDLRLADNTALNAALNEADEVIPVYILDKHLLASTRLRGPRIAWMLDGLRILDSDLHQYGSRLIIRQGDPFTELQILLHETQANGVYFNRDYSPYAIRRDEKIRAELRREGYLVKDFKDLVIHEAAETITAQGKFYGVYTPYRKVWLDLPKTPILDASKKDRLRLNGGLNGLSSMPIPNPAEYGSTPAQNPIVPPGESTALQQFESFIDGPIFRYAEMRNAPALDGTSGLSPYLRWGMISPRTCYHYAQAAAAKAPEKGRHSVNIWINELIWREFHYQILAQNPHIVQHSFRHAYETVAWENNPDYLKAWANGRTGFPIIDAGIRQLQTSGWMHNRSRILTASFLCKDLLTDWRFGEAIFMQYLLDGDVANNVGGWQWTAGIGTDATPYFRIFNPIAQSKKFDRNGDYIRQWLPELRNVPSEFIHTPSDMTLEQQGKYGCMIGEDYPAPIIDHAVQRERALKMYRAARH